MFQYALDYLQESIRLVISYPTTGAQEAVWQAFYKLERYLREEGLIADMTAIVPRNKKRDALYILRDGIYDEVPKT